LIVPVSLRSIQGCFWVLHNCCRRSKNYKQKLPVFAGSYPYIADTVCSPFKREQERDMQPHHNHTATLSAIAGFLIMFLLAGLFAEKSHEGHLPEQNNRAATSIPMAAGIVAGAVVLTVTASGIARGRNSTSPMLHQLTHKTMPCCPAMP